MFSLKNPDLESLDRSEPEDHRKWVHAGGWVGSREESENDMTVPEQAWGGRERHYCASFITPYQKRMFDFLLLPIP